MSFTHIAAFAWNEGEGGRELAEQVKRALLEYVETLDGVELYICGADAGVTPGTADFGVVARFSSFDAFVTYRDDPRHQEILATQIVPHLASRSVVQLEG